jgi:kynurenine formamidase
VAPQRPSFGAGTWSQNMPNMQSMKIIDLSQNIEMGQPVYPGLAKTLINTWNTFEETARVQGGSQMKRLYTTCSIFMSDHASTHIDAIVHFGQRKGTAEQIPLEGIILLIRFVK